MKKKIVRTKLWEVLGISTMLFAHQLAFGQSLSEVVDQTIKTNPDVLIDADGRLALDHTVEQARGGYYPKVDLALGVGREGSENINTAPGRATLWRRESSLTLSQMLYDGYAVKSEVDRNQSRVESAAHRVASTSEHIGLRAVEVFLEVLRRQELLALTQENLVAHERTYQQIKLRADSGVARKADMEQVQTRLSFAQANLVSSQANLQEAQINFQRVAGNAPDNLDKPVDVDCELFPGTLDDAVNFSYSNNPALRAAIAQYEAGLADEQGAKSAFKPKLNLNLGTSWNHDLNGVDFKNNTAYAMLRMQYNLFNGGADKAHIAETQHLSQAAIEVVNRTKRELEESTRRSWNALETAKDRLPQLKAYVDAQVLTRDAYAKQFNIGQRTLLDLLDAENEVYKARSDYLNAQYDEHFARYRLMADMGKLLETLGVAPRDESKTAANQP